jgi:thioglycine synthase
MNSSLHLERRQKHASPVGLSNRIVPVQDTLNRVMPLCKSFGVTRIADITRLDRLYIPNYSLTLPGTQDTIWVYGGKGPTKSHAKASAIMESIERYSSFPRSYARCYIRGTYKELSKSYDKVLHHDEMVEPVREGYEDYRDPIDFVTGFDLLNNTQVLVPAEIALYRYDRKPLSPRIFLRSHTNGLASGNVLEEAICHALCEVIEIDAVSIADLCASTIPYNILDTIADSFKEENKFWHPLTKAHIADNFVDDASIFPDVDISKIAEDCEPIQHLIGRFSKAGIPLILKNITQRDIGIPTISASTIESISSNYGYFAKGYGTHPDARIALVRAITEVSQTRAANIQGARDDLRKIVYRENDEIYKRKWQFMRTANNKHPDKRIIDFCEIDTYVNQDILRDIRLILERLKMAGLKRVVVVDLTNQKIGIPVVRVIVPGLETFDVTNSIMGLRAKNCFKDLIAEKNASKS